MAVYTYVFVFALFVYIHEVKSTGVAPNIKLNDGREIPALGLGTWLGFKRDGSRVPVEDDSVEKAVGYAIDAGYRHVDTAHIYKTEEQVGRAINKKITEGVIKREDIFVTTKLWNDHHAKEDVVPALKESLKQLNLEYVDLFLIHWPVGLLANGSYDNTDILVTWQGMIEARDQGLTKSIGVSNFNEQQLNRLITLSHVKPAVLQVEVNLNLQQSSLLEYCRQQNITVTGYTPFGSLFPSKALDNAPPPRVDEPALVKLANKYNKTVPQITLRYLVEIGVIPIPKSTTKSRIEENLAVFDFSLTQKERDLLKSYDKGHRTIPVLHWIDHINYPFEKKIFVQGPHRVMADVKVYYLCALAFINIAWCFNSAPLIKLNDGRKIPSFGLGTWLGPSKGKQGLEPVKDDSVKNAVEWAIDAGYRHIDTARIYDTEEQIGQAIKKAVADGKVSRDELFITTKLWNDAHARDAVVPALRESLRKLGLDYVDLYLIHWPIGQFSNYTFDTTDYLDTWQGMIEAQKLGLAKSIGVSNFNQEQLERLISSSGVKPANLQIEVNLNLQQPALRAYCKQQNISVTAYTPFGSLFPSKAEADAPPPRVDDPALVKIAKKYNKTVPQIALRYLVELGVIPIPKTTTKSRVEQNIAIFDFELTQPERDLMKSYDRGYRSIKVNFWENHPYYPFE
ncbi:uncharacterized protein ACR2FA_009809 [Aphomia sociella]